MRGLTRALAALVVVLLLAGFSAPQIAAVDALLQSVGERLALAEAVAQAKWNSGAAVDDPEREAELLASVPAGLQRDFVRAQIEANKDIQRALLRSYYGQGRFPDADLGRVRPKITAVTARMVEQLQVVEPLVGQDGFAELVKERAKVVLPNVPFEVRDRALAPLLEKQLQKVEGQRGGRQGRGLAWGVVGRRHFDDVGAHQVQLQGF